MSTTRSPNRKEFEFRLDLESGVPVYRQIIDQVMGGMAAGTLAGGHQLPTVRQVAVDLSINPNTVVRAYRELEIRGVLETQQGTGTFISHQKVKRDDVERAAATQPAGGRISWRAPARPASPSTTCWSNYTIGRTVPRKRGDKAMRPDQNQMRLSSVGVSLLVVSLAAGAGVTAADRQPDARW